jgi:hypothetical protein
VAEGFEQAVVVEPPDPLEGGELDVVERAPGTAWSDELSLEEPDDGLGQRVVVGVTAAAHRWFDACESQSLGVVDREVLHASVAVVDQPLRGLGQTFGDRLFEGVER